jgi:hypothetical protein
MEPACSATKRPPAVVRSFLRIGQWGNDRAIPVDAAVSLLLSPCRESSPPAPWELARLSEAERKGRGDVFTRPCRRPVLGIIVPEFNTAVPIYDQRVPKSIFALRDAPLAVRYAVAIGLARLLKVRRTPWSGSSLTAMPAAGGACWRKSPGGRQHRRAF